MEEKVLGRPILQVRNLSKRYTRPGALLRRDDEFEAVSDVSFDMHEGEILSLLGESGCGKTTLARMLMHLLRPTSGQILLDELFDEIRGAPLHILHILPILPCRTRRP